MKVVSPDKINLLHDKNCRLTRCLNLLCDIICMIAIFEYDVKIILFIVLNLA